MKRFFNLVLVASCVLSLFMFQSCDDKDYDWDNIDTKGQIVLPPVLIGSFDPVVLGEDIKLPNIPPIEDLPDFGVSVAYKYDFKDLFNDDLIDYFFYEGNEVTLSGLVDISVYEPGSDADFWLGITFEVLDENDRVISEIKIPDQKGFVEKADQPIKIEIASQYMKYFEAKSARHLRANLIINASSIRFKDDASITFKDIVLKSKALQYEL